MTDQFAAPAMFRAELRDALLSRAATMPAVGQTSRTVRTRRRAGRLTGAIALASAAAAAVLVLVSGGTLRPQPATAASVLNASAAALEHRGGSRALGPGDYFYSRIRVWWRYSQFTSRPYVVRSIQEEWLARDGNGRSRYDVIGVSGARGGGLPLTRSQDARLRAQARPFILSAAPPILVSYEQLRALPTDPGRLSAMLDRLAARYHVDRLFPQRDIRAAIRFAMLRELAELPSSASVRAALYRALAHTPGIRLLGRTQDSIGRYGTALAVDVDGARLELILDPASGELLQTSRTLLYRSRAYPNQPIGLINRATYLATGIVASTSARVK
jgi:hypothetical protein